MLLFKTTKEDSGKRLDHVLTQKTKKITRSQIKKIIKAGNVTVDGVPAKVHQFLKSGQTVEVSQNTLQETSRRPLPAVVPPEIIAENDDYLILNKPAGLLVHPTEKKELFTLASWLEQRYPKLASVGEHNRAGIVHRLDRDVSGLMVIAKNQKMFDHLKKQFQLRLVTKKYWALVYGNTTKDTEEINLPIGRNKDGQFVAHPTANGEKLEASDRNAKTIYHTKEHIKNYSLLDIEIKTGRTHQIRVHLSAVGHPIMGDNIYKPRKKFYSFLQRKIKVIEPGRIFLHAYKLGFSDAENVYQEFTIELPLQLLKFLNDLRS